MFLKSDSDWADDKGLSHPISFYESSLTCFSAFKTALEESCVNNDKYGVERHAPNVTLLKTKPTVFPSALIFGNDYPPN